MRCDLFIKMIDIEKFLFCRCRRLDKDINKRRIFFKLSASSRHVTVIMLATIVFFLYPWIFPAPYFTTDF